MGRSLLVPTEIAEPLSESDALLFFDDDFWLELDVSIVIVRSTVNSVFERF